MPSLPLEELEPRISALQSGMVREGFDGALIVQRADLFYFSGTGQDAHLFIPVDGPARLLVRKDFERAGRESPLKDVAATRSLTDVQYAVLSSRPGALSTLGMELDVLPVNNFRLYEHLFPGTEIRDLSPLIKEVRMVKSPYELDILKQAAAMNDEMFAQVAGILKEGMTEIEFSGLLEAFYRRKGHQGYIRVRSFNQEVFYGHVMSGPNLAVPSCAVGPTGGPGPNPSLPHGAGFKAIGRREPVQVDYVGILDGYMVDQARTFFLGEPPREFVSIHSTALEIQQVMIDQGRPGVRAEALYENAVRMAIDAGLERGFLGYPLPVPFVGHGVGIELDEFPLVGKKSPHILQEGMVIALEPKFILPGKGLAGIENTFVVREHGLERLTRFDDAIQVLE